MATDQVELVKSKTDIVQVIGERVALKRAGRHFKGLCPFHSEKSPSFMVSPERQSYKCFGCQEGGDAIAFLQKYDGMSFFEALEALAKRAGVTLEDYRPSAADSERKRLLTLMSLASEYYHYLLTKHESGREAREYLKKRGVTNEAISQFYLGFAPAQWRSVSDFLIKKKQYTPQELEKTGMVIRQERATGYYDRFRGRVMFPLKDHKGVVVGFSGRTLSPDTKEAKYINSPETSLYSKGRMLYGLWENREAIRKADQLVLVEGELDVIPSWQAGVKQVAAIKGSAFTPEQAQLVSRYTKNVAMSLDADLAGQEAIKRAVVVAEPLDMSIRVVQVEGGKDPGEVASANPRAWREQVARAALYWDFLLDSAMARHNPGSGEGTSAISREVVPAIAGISNLVMRAHYVSELSSRLHVPEASIYDEITRLAKRRELSTLKETVAKIERGATNRREELSLYVLSLALQYYNVLHELFGTVQSAWFSHPAAAKLFAALSGWDAEQPFTIQAFAAKLPPELAPTLDECYLRDLPVQADEVVREWQHSSVELEVLAIRDQQKALAAEIAKAESGKGGEVLLPLQEEFSRLSRRLSEIT